MTPREVLLKLSTLICETMMLFSDKEIEDPEMLNLMAGGLERAAKRLREAANDA